MVRLGLLLFLLTLICMASCSTPPVQVNRSPASTISPVIRSVFMDAKKCKLKQSEDPLLYQVIVNGDPYNDYYYEYEYASELLNFFEKQGKCAS